ncbi:MAG: PQQ-like beta-propeller repeat protein [Planctomycetia bacterium]|nr:PQQ-like beta-propeller repeat protein [Planctomycetia bacterium]
MSKIIPAILIPVLVGVVGAVLIVLWLGTDSAVRQSIEARVPRKGNVVRAASTGGPGGPRDRLSKGDGVAADLPGAWPRFRGPNIDGVSDEEVALARQWPMGRPAELWSIEVGMGYAGAAVLAGRVYIIDYDRRRQADVVRCLSLADGKDIWQYSYPVKIKQYHGMSRTVPTVTEKYVVAIGPKCHVICLDSVTGEFRWALDLVGKFGATVPDWYAGQCPLIDGDRVIIAPGGESLMIAVDIESGEVVWRTPNPRRWQMTHSSIMPMEFKGRRMYVYCASGGVVGVSAEDGKILWETEAWKIRIANVPTPVPVGDGRIFLSGGYQSGSMMLQLSESDGVLKAETLFRLKHMVFGADQQTPILYEGYIYGVKPGGQMVCLDLTGKPVWTSGSAHRFGLGPYMIADGMILAMNDSGVLTLAEATPAGYRQLAQADVLEKAKESWGPMALAGGRLIVRDFKRMVCLDMRAQAGEGHVAR